MIKYLISLVLLLFAGSAFADYPAVFKEGMFNNSAGSYIPYSTPEQACQKSVTSFNPNGVKSARFYFSGPANLQNSYNCEWTWADGSTQLVGKQITFHCPYLPSTLNGSNCVGTSTGAPPPCADKTPFDVSHKVTVTTTGGVTTTKLGFPSVFSGCKIDPMEMIRCYEVPSSGDRYCIWRVVRTGETSTATNEGLSAATPANPTDKPIVSPSMSSSSGSCPKGTVMAGIDQGGTAICVGTGTAPSNPPTAIPPVVTKPPVVVNNADGSTTTTTETIKTNSDGSQTVTKNTVTTAADGTKTTGGTTTTGTTPSGSAGKSDGSAEDAKNDLCKANPTLAVCRNSSVSGTCAQVACEGDAIQCATLRAIATMECREKKNEDDTAALPSTSLGNSILAGADPMKGQIDSAIAGTTVNMQSSLDQAGFLARSCFGNKSFTVGGRVITVEFASLCQGIEPLKYIILSCAMLVAYLIVAKSVLGT